MKAQPGTDLNAARGDWFAPVVRIAIAPTWAAWERSSYLQHYRRLLKSQFDSREQIATRQLTALQSIARFAYAAAPFWKARFDEVGLKPRDMHSFDDFRQVP